MKKVIKLLVAACVAAATLSGCIVVPAGGGPRYHDRGYYGPGPGYYYGR